MNIFIVNRKTKIENIQKKYPNALILDITSKSPYAGLRILSPFYPHGGIPVPGLPGITATCVEAIWQGLKVFESCGVDYSLFTNDTMQNIKRTVRKYGKPIGHQYGDKILNYQDARMYIYIPTYKYVLDNKDSEKMLFSADDYKDLIASNIYSDLFLLSDKVKMLLSILQEYLTKTSILDLEPFHEVLERMQASLTIDSFLILLV